MKLIARWMDAPKGSDVSAITRSRFVELREIGMVVTSCCWPKGVVGHKC